jgi:hypothetical protein
VLSDERAQGRIRVDAGRIKELEKTNFDELEELTKNGRVAVEA